MASSGAELETAGSCFGGGQPIASNHSRGQSVRIIGNESPTRLLSKGDLLLGCDGAMVCASFRRELTRWKVAVGISKCMNRSIRQFKDAVKLALLRAPRWLVRPVVQ